MKTRLLIILAFSSFVAGQNLNSLQHLSTSSSSSNEGISSITLFAGGNYTNLHENGEGKLSFYGGFGYEFDLSSWLSFFFGGYYSNQGDILTQNTQSGNFYSITKTDYSLHYLTIPILLKFYMGRRVNLQLGGEMNFLSSAKANISSDAGFSEVDLIYEYFESNELIDFSGVLGAEVFIGNRFSINAKYKIPITDVLEEKLNISNNVLFFGVNFFLMPPVNTEPSASDVL